METQIESGDIPVEITDPTAFRIYADRARHIRMLCTRRGRKTSLGTLISLVRASRRGFPTRHLTIAPTYEQAMECIEHIFEFYPHFIVDYHKSSRTLVTTGGGRIMFRSADRGVRRSDVRGKGYTHVHTVESAYIPDEVWYSAIRPTISGNPNTTTFCEGTIDTEAGWFYQEVLRGLPAPITIKSGDTGYTYMPLENPDGAFSSYIITAEASRYLSDAEINELRVTMPKAIFNQEYMCIPGSQGGKVFEHFLVSDYKPDFIASGCVMGLDLAKVQDFTVMIGLVKREGRYLVNYFKRMNKQEYSAQVPVLTHWARKHKSSVYYDATGVGKAVGESLEREYGNCIPINFNTDSKRQMVENLVVMLEQEQIELPESLPRLRHELQIFKATRSAAGNVQYSAPGGEHDDCVMALALAAWGVKKAGRYNVLVV